MSETTLICADLSMNRPGFAVQRFDADKKEIAMLYKSNIDNKNASKKCHGQKLGEIAHELKQQLTNYPDAILVRETALAMVSISAKTIQVQHKVVGVADLYAWALGKREWLEVWPTAVKSLVAGNKDAKKEEVAAAQDCYVGHQDYACDDESDAVAVGVAYLLQQKAIEPKEIPPWNG